MMQVMQTISASPWMAGFKAVTCSNAACARWLTQRHLSSRKVGVTLEEQWYCSYSCAEPMLTERISRMLGAAPRQSSWSSRMPLALILMSRGLLTPEQVREATDEHRRSGGELGEIFVRMGFVGEKQVTAARATQWGCPVFEPFRHSLPEHIHIPLTLIKLYSMVPLHYVAATNSLLVGFVNGIEYGPLYAVEQVIGCQTQACFVTPSDFHEQLRGYEHGGVARAGATKTESMHAPAKMARVLTEHCGMLGANEVSLAKSMQYVWVRLKKAGQVNDFLFRV